MLWFILAISSAFFVGIKEILAKKIFRKNIYPSQLIFEENFLLLLIIIVLFSFKVDYSSFFKLWYLYFLKSISLGSASILYLKLLKKYDISIVSPLLNLSPMFLLFLSFFFLGEIISNLQVLGIIIIIAATYFLEVTFKHHNSNSPHKSNFNMIKKININFFIIIFISLFIISLTAIVDKKILSQTTVYSNLFFTSIIIFIMLLIYYIYEKTLLKNINNLIKEPETLLISIFSILSNFLILFAISIPTAKVSLLIPLKRTSTLFSALIGGILFHEKHLKQKIIATCFMLIGVFLIVI